MTIKYRVINKLGSFLKGRHFRGTCQESGSSSNIEDVVVHHFNTYSYPDHPCRATLSMALKLLGGRAASIVETGSSAYGTNSSLLFDRYVGLFGGTFDTVDIRPEPSYRLRRQCQSSTCFHIDDSVSFLKKWEQPNGGRKIDLLYLDSWDVNWLAPEPSALHGLAEYLAACDCLQSGSLLLIDDTPIDSKIMENVQPTKVDQFIASRNRLGFSPGKGAIVKQLLESLGRGKMIAHEYQLLWQF